jgi:hypothetical protein
MAIRHYLVLLLCFFGVSNTFGQMVFGKDTLVGNEWIRYDKSYFKFTVDADGVYRIPYATIQSAGIGADAAGSKFRLYNMGQQVPIFVSTDDAFGASDFIEFYGYKNRGEMDRHLFRLPDDDMLHPDHSMYTDVRVYYLTTDDGTSPFRVNQLVNDITNPPAAEPYYLHKDIHQYSGAFNDLYYQIPDGGAISYSSYMHAEGFCKASEPISTTTIDISNLSNTGPDALLHIRLASTNYGQHQFVVTWNNLAIDTIDVENIKIVDKTYSLNTGLLLASNQLRISSLSTQSRHSLVNVELTYARTFTSFGSVAYDLFVEPGGGSRYFVLDGFQHNGVKPILYGENGQTRMVAEINQNDQVHFVWPPNLQNTGLHIINPDVSIHTINSLEQKAFTDLSADDTEYIIITHPALMETGTESAYIQYRMSAAGGSYKAKAYSILDIYDQFGYGIEKHPQAIRNFVEFFHHHWPSAKMIFIVGRAIEYNRSRYASGTWEPLFFVPTFGRPGSDNLLAATLWNLVPRYPIGRLAITHPQGIAMYLNKVKEHDLSRFTGQSIAEKLWIKNVMHLSGGKTNGEQNDFRNTLESLGEELAASDYGAQIRYFQKESTDVIGETQNAQILKLLHEGCGIINYLGHSATSTFEFQISDPSEWNNKGHYPVFSAMGCSAGQIHGPVLSLSDNYVQIPDEGSVAFISGSGSQFASALEEWASPWYNYFGNSHYGATLGESILAGLTELKGYINIELIGSNSYRYLLEQQTFQGDPALQLHPFPGPDYVVDRSSVTISPEVLNSKLDSFDLTFSISNIGRNLRQNVGYTIQIRLPDGQSNVVEQGTVVCGTFTSVITTKIPIKTGGKSGSFRLLISVDPVNLLEELPAPDAEANNKLIDNLGVEGVEFLVIDNLISAVYPPDFSIVTTPVPELVATGSNSFVLSQDFVAQIDTTALFNSPSMVQEKIFDHSSTLKWSPAVSWVPDQVYYWRVSTDSISPDQGYLWSRKSFLYKPGSSPGWNQSHFMQHTDNELTHLLADSSAFTFTFGSKLTNFNILNRFHDVVQGLIPKVVIDGVIKAEFFTAFRERNVQTFVVVIDSLTGNFIYNPNPGIYGSFNHLSFDAPCFAYRTDTPESRQALIDFIENVVPSGYYVFLYTYQRPSYPDYFPELWEADEVIYGKSIFSLIENQYPSSAIRTLATTGSKPYIVFFQKDRGGIQELIAIDSVDIISTSVDLKGSLTEGAHVSRLIGPSSQWYAIQYSMAAAEIDTAGRNVLSAIALSTDFTDTLLISTNLISQDTNIADIDAEEYPYILLTFTTEDSITYDPADLQFWRVMYEGYPELAISTDLGFEFVADSLFQGEEMSLRTYVENVSPYDVDSMPASMRIISASQTKEVKTIIPEIKAHASAPVEFTRNTKDLLGNYQVLMEVNPGRHVKEFNYNNNLGILPTYIEGDFANPVLDVTFDGYHISDGDLVSFSPFILARLHDENQYLLLDDTSSFEIYLEFPSDNEPRRIYFTNPWLKFTGATSTDSNIATAALTPELIENGIYTLRVIAKDGSGNNAGDNDYFVSFEVILDKSVSYIYNYPNPFSTATRFVYTLTGNSSPAFYKIEIVSITGITVREITQDEMGPLAAGHHTTEYVWDGSGQNGSQLAAGIYFYRLVVKDENMKDYERYVPYGDSAYTNEGWGKLVIIR